MNPNLSILLVDDDEIDRELVQRALRAAGIHNPVTTASNGLEALAILRGEDPQATLGRPAMVLLDLNMPQMNGFEFLEALRADSSLSGIVVFVLSTSTRQEDIERCQRYQVAGYMSKQTAGQDVCLLSELLDSYWRLVNVADETP
ncbi:MAG: response regulator [Burkholderiaceae bacterium]